MSTRAGVEILQRVSRAHETYLDERSGYVAEGSSHGVWTLKEQRLNRRDRDQNAKGRRFPGPADHLLGGVAAGCHSKIV